METKEWRARYISPKRIPRITACIMSSLNFVELKNRSKLTIELERIRGNPKIV